MVLFYGRMCFYGLKDLADAIANFLINNRVALNLCEGI
jgi:hypothetical protein